MILTVESIGNYYGNLNIKEDGGRFFWGIENWDGDYGWEEIPKSLHEEILKYIESVDI